MPRETEAHEGWVLTGKDLDSRWVQVKWNGSRLRRQRKMLKLSKVAAKLSAGREDFEYPCPVPPCQTAQFPEFLLRWERTATESPDCAGPSGRNY